MSASPAATPSLDAPSAVEFMREALIKISEEEIAEVAERLETKRDRMLPVLESLSPAAPGGARQLLEQVFATRRRAADVLDAVGAAGLADAVATLLRGPGPVADRFTAFDDRLAPVAPPIRRDFAGECLKMYDPDRYWLWSRWMWDPKTETGSLPLVLVSGYDLHGPHAGEIYDKVGVAIQTVVETAHEIGFHRLRASRFAVDVYLAAIYGVYLYTVTRLRMTQEFNKIIPQLPELVRRLLGVHRLEAGA